MLAALPADRVDVRFSALQRAEIAEMRQASIPPGR